MMLRRCDMHSAVEPVSIKDHTGKRYNYIPDVQCDDVAEWVVDDGQGNVYYVCLNHIGYVFHNKPRAYKVSPLIDKERI